MKFALRVILLAVVAGLGFWLWTVLFPSPEKIVLKKIANLAETVSVEPSDGNITRATKVSNLLSYFSPDVEIAYDVQGIGAHVMTGRDEVRETAAGAMTQISSLKVQFFDATARVGPDRLTAEVNCTARVNVGDNKDFGIQELRIQFQKRDGEWRITRAETVKTLK